MKYWILKSIILLGIILISACGPKDDLADAYGNFESRDQMVFSEMPGKLMFFNVETGNEIKKGDTIGMVDTLQLHLKKQQLYASIKAIKGKLQNASPQQDLIRKQITVLDKEKNRVLSLLKDEAATQKQLDDIQGKIDVFHQQIKTIEAQTQLANSALLSQIAPIKSQIIQIDDQIDRCFIKNPMSGTVLLKFAESGDILNPAKPLYKIANTKTLELRAYISGDQLADIKLGQKLWVEVDANKEEMRRFEGKVTWIAEKAEFTPKTIQTKEERVNLVYAIKVSVDNASGKLKIGMPGEIKFKKEEPNEE